MRRTRWATRLCTAAALICAPGCGRNGHEPQPGPQPGDPAPPYAAASLAGDTVSLASLRGDVVLLTVWATDCAPCLAQIPALRSLQRTYADSGLRIVAVSVDRDGEAARRLVREQGLSWVNLLDDEAHVAQTFRVGPGVPRTILLDGSGTVQGSWSEPLDSAKLRRIRDVLVTAGSSKLEGSLVLARGLDPASVLDTLPEIDPRAVSPAVRAAAQHALGQLGRADERCTRYFVWESATYVQVLGSCPFTPGAGVEQERGRILSVAPNGLLTAADQVWYIRLCPAQRDTAGRPLPLDGGDCLVRENRPVPDRR